MLLLNLAYNIERDDIFNGIKSIKEYFKSKNINIGISESVECKTHFLKIFSDCELNKKLINVFNIYAANMLYDILIDEFYNKELDSFLNDMYFFLQNDEMNYIKNESLNIIKGKISIVDDNSIYCINKKNNIIKKIATFIDENNTINVEGFITFRMKDILDDIKSIIDKIVEEYMVEKEYDEFIKLLKYFVEIQESKIDYMDIVIENSGDYIIKNKHGIDITTKLFSQLTEFKTDKNASTEDLLISTLITNSPEKIIIHSIENCRNKEVIDTIKKVFTDRVMIYK
ncbi:putative sporulation protein YtxC [Clostridium algifaecis]|uniref:Sporulation protein YtxC n=1 Tax=Clostridium algifaecis TaxID=1472040 RepID=A0ABS4KTU7_9CLOT|nr:putative sporulation protein YtxC [Clostridium algifaecis]MBP2032861.1 putative sporulation protein YtxC [Clostridium algifaecis]